MRLENSYGVAPAMADINIRSNQIFYSVAKPGFIIAVCFEVGEDLRQAVRLPKCNHPGPLRTGPSNCRRLPGC